MDPAAASSEKPEGAAPGGEGAPPPGVGRCVESSWDLRRGLTVREGLPPDAGLDEWLEAMLRE